MNEKIVELNENDLENVVGGVSKQKTTAEMDQVTQKDTTGKFNVTFGDKTDQITSPAFPDPTSNLSRDDLKRKLLP